MFPIHSTFFLLLTFNCRSTQCHWPHTLEELGCFVRPCMLIRRCTITVFTYPHLILNNHLLYCTKSYIMLMCWWSLGMRLRLHLLSQFLACIDCLHTESHWNGIILIKTTVYSRPFKKIWCTYKAFCWQTAGTNIILKTTLLYKTLLSQYDHSAHKTIIFVQEQQNNFTFHFHKGQEFNLIGLLLLWFKRNSDNPKDAAVTIDGQQWLYQRTL